MELGLEVTVPAHQHGGQTDERVQESDELGHLGHLHAARTHQTDPGTDDDGDSHQGDADRGGLVIEDQDDSGHQSDGHAGDTEGQSATGGLMLGQACQGQDEQQRCDEVGRVGGGHE